MRSICCVFDVLFNNLFHYFFCQANVDNPNLVSTYLLSNAELEAQCKVSISSRFVLN